MAVTPMDLQVVFMQEGKAAREAERQRRFPSEVRNRLGRRTVAESLRESVDATEAAESKVIEEDGGRGSTYFFRGRPRHRPEEEENGGKAPQEEGKGAQIDLQA
jgi:hypothetical protein